MDVLKTFVVDMSAVFGFTVVGLAVCAAVSSRIKGEQRRAESKLRFDQEIARDETRNKRLEIQAPANYVERTGGE